LGLAFWRDFAYQNVVRFHFGADVNDARFIQLGQQRLADVGYIGSDFLGAQLGVAGHAGQFFNMNGGVTFFLHHAFGDQNRVFEVVAVPGHERHQHVLTQRQFAHVGGRTVGQHIAARNDVAGVDQRPLIDAGVLVRAGVLGEVVNVHTDVALLGFVVVDAYDDSGRVHRVHHAAT